MSTSFDSFQSADIKYARKLFDEDAGGVLILRLDDGYCVPPAATALVVEHRPIEARQHYFNVPAGTAVPRRLAAGSYTAVVTATGYEPFRAHLDIVAGGVTELVAKLEQVRTCAPTLRQIVERYGIRWNEHAVHDLVVPEGAAIALDSRSPDYADHRHAVRIDNVERAKEAFGIPDTHWPGGAARYGTQYSAEPRDVDKGRASLAMLAALREYIYGNSKSVAPWRGMLNELLARDPIEATYYVYQNIDVGRNAMLVLGDTSLLCNRLRVHFTGRVVVTGAGPVRVEMNRYQLYGIYAEVSATSDPKFVPRAAV